MANYDFRCKQCGEETMVQVPMSEYEFTDPPECHGPMKRVFNGHMAIRLSVKGINTPKGQPYYGDHEQRERRMAAARKQANPGIG
jgi:putative FmdB family regulatory protein